MLTINRLSCYFGGLIVFLKEIAIDGNVYNKGETYRVTPAILYLCATGAIDVNKDIALILRELNQLENHEIKELCGIVLPRFKLLDFPVVVRSGVGSNAIVQLEIDDNNTFIIGYNYDLHLCTKAIKNGNPDFIISNVFNQSAAFEWFVGKHLDIFKLINNGCAYRREQWTSKDYE